MNPPEASSAEGLQKKAFNPSISGGFSPFALQSSLLSPAFPLSPSFRKKMKPTPSRNPSEPKMMNTGRQKPSSPKCFATHALPFSAWRIQPTSAPLVMSPM